MKRVLLIDDKRTNTDQGCGEATVIARTYDEGLSLLLTYKWDILLIDHDLGDFKDGVERTGYHIMCHLEEEDWRNKQGAEQGSVPGLEYHPLPKEIYCVSSNGPGRARIQVVIDKLKGDQQ